MSTLTREAVQQWMHGQQVAQEEIERERIQFLCNLTPQEALRIYLSINSATPNLPGRQTPSPVLWAMRRALVKTLPPPLASLP